MQQTQQPTQRHGELQPFLLLHAEMAHQASRLPELQLADACCAKLRWTCPSALRMRDTPSGRGSAVGIAPLFTIRPAALYVQEVCTLAAVAEQVSAPSPPAASGNVVLEVKDLEVSHPFAWQADLLRTATAGRTCLADAFC